MEGTSILTLISSVGFPIVACIAMGYYVKYITDKNHSAIGEMTKTHQAESAAFTKALENNTLAVQKLSYMIDYTTIGCERSRPNE